MKVNKKLLHTEKLMVIWIIDKIRRLEVLKTTISKVASMLILMDKYTCLSICLSISWHCLFVCLSISLSELFQRLETCLLCFFTPDPFVAAMPLVNFPFSFFRFLFKRFSCQTCIQASFSWLIAVGLNCYVSHSGTVCIKIVDPLHHCPRLCAHVVNGWENKWNKSVPFCFAFF